MRFVDACLLCSSSRLAPFGVSRAGPATLHSAQVRCQDCGLLISQPQAEEADLENYYRSHFYEEFWPDAEANWAQHLDLRARYEWPIMQKLWADFAPPSGATVAEIGCGYGGFLGLLERNGYHTKGCEMSERAIAFCRRQGLDVVPGQAPGIPFEKGAFDVSVSMQVIEHVTDPRGFAREMTELVRPGGAVVIATEDAWNSQYAFQRLWAQGMRSAAPFRSSNDHTCVFTPSTLERLLADVGCDHIGVRSYNYVPPVERWHWRLRKGFFRTVDRVIGRGELLIAVGRRRD